jgi:uncharacterized membrane protein
MKKLLINIFLSVSLSLLIVLLAVFFGRIIGFGLNYGVFISCLIVFLGLHTVKYVNSRWGKDNQKEPVAK